MQNLGHIHPNSALCRLSPKKKSSTITNRWVFQDFPQSFQITCPFSYHFLGVKNGLPQQIPMVFSTFPHPHMGFPLCRGSETSTPSSKALVQTRRFFSPRRNWSICWFRTPEQAVLLAVLLAGRKIYGKTRVTNKKQNYILMYLDRFWMVFLEPNIWLISKISRCLRMAPTTFFQHHQVSAKTTMVFGYPRTQRQVGSQFWWCTPLVTSAWHENSIYNTLQHSVSKSTTHINIPYHNISQSSSLM